MLKFRFAEPGDVDIYFKWVNDLEVRINSYHQEPIKYEDHLKWFQNEINSNLSFLYLFITDTGIPFGQVRLQEKNRESIIDISIDKNFRGRSLASPMLQIACDDYLKKHPGKEIFCYIKIRNQPSLNSFLKAGFVLKGTVLIHNEESYFLTKTGNLDKSNK
jgi:RimJ/RimL family protein N-acetyltransferase